MSYSQAHFKMKNPLPNPRNKKRLDKIQPFCICSKNNYFTSKLALLDSCLASAEDLSTEVSSPYPL
jgi:hypothetical protein